MIISYRKIAHHITIYVEVYKFEIEESKGKEDGGDTSLVKLYPVNGDRPFTIGCDTDVTLHLPEGLQQIRFVKIKE